MLVIQKCRTRTGWSSQRELRLSGGNGEVGTAVRLSHLIKMKYNSSSISRQDDHADVSSQFFMCVLRLVFRVQSALRSNSLDTSREEREEDGHYQCLLVVYGGVGITETTQLGFFSLEEDKFYSLMAPRHDNAREVPGCRNNHFFSR